ncbi:hypothetical protein E4T85_00030 [Bacillus stratosphericus]|nr:hypothetical protein E4T85_00030 [Bacillus stratosphericus]
MGKEKKHTVEVTVGENQQIENLSKEIEWQSKKIIKLEQKLTDAVVAITHLKYLIEKVLPSDIETKGVKKPTISKKYVPYEERRIIEHGIEYAPMVKGLGKPILMTKEEEESLEPQTFEEPPLLQITLKDMDSIPEVIHKGESLEWLINIGFNWETSGPDEFGSAYINLQNADVGCKHPVENRTEYKRGKAMNELPTKDDLVWDKERGVYILPKKK